LNSPQHEGDLHPLPPPWYCLDKVTCGAQYNGQQQHRGWCSQAGSGYQVAGSLLSCHLCGMCHNHSWYSHNLCTSRRRMCCSCLCSRSDRFYQRLLWLCLLCSWHDCWKHLRYLFRRLFCIRILYPLHFSCFSHNEVIWFGLIHMCSRSDWFY